VNVRRVRKDALQELDMIKKSISKDDAQRNQNEVHVVAVLIRIFFPLLPLALLCRYRS
jgi:hypothetical protein